MNSGLTVEQAGIALSLVLSLLSFAYAFGVNAARVEALRAELAGLNEQLAELRGVLLRGFRDGG